jgi:hypothetical protein
MRMGFPGALERLHAVWKERSTVGAEGMEGMWGLRIRGMGAGMGWVMVVVMALMARVSRMRDRWKSA